MPISTAQFSSLFDEINRVPLFQAAPPPPPTRAEMEKKIQDASDLLPVLYRQDYATPLVDNWARLQKQLGTDAGAKSMLETLGGAVYQHADKKHKPELSRFLAVISDLYRSFLSSRRRVRAHFPIRETVPPLAMFQHDGESGPFTIPCDDVKTTIGSNVGVVSLPATYRDQPLLWASLAHETGGHDVLHADPGLLGELRDSVHTNFAQNGFPAKLATLWDYWMDEAASDIYGVMNIGPSFGLNLIVFFAALNAQGSGSGKPALRSASGADETGALDPHPTDVLRPFLIAGAIDALTNLSRSVKQSYVDDIERLALAIAPSATQIAIEGTVTQQLSGRVVFEESYSFDEMRDAAQRVGAMIATTKLNALSQHFIQEIETWDDSDEQTAVRIATALARNQSIVALGDDAQLLAGATLAAYDDPAAYGSISKRLNEALDASFNEDPYWGKPSTDRVFLRQPVLSAAAEAATQAAFAPDPLAQQIIEYDSDRDMGPEGVTAFARRVLSPIPWPKGSAPQPKPSSGGDKELVPHDYLVVTWTVEEAKALADVLTPGVSSKQWSDYSHLWKQYKSKIRNGAPASKSERLGSFCSTQIGNSSVLCFKSELHMSQDGPDLPIADLWKQLVDEVKPKLVITTGTAGAIGPHLELGDVVLSRTTRFDCLKSFKNRDFAQSSYASNAADFSELPDFLQYANRELIGVNAGQLPAARRLPRVFASDSQLGQRDVVVTTDFFAFDDSSDFYHLQGLGSAVEMGDAVLGYVASQMGKHAPAWLAIRNASDPQIGGNASISQKAKEAAGIYMKFGYWTTVCSAIACWAAIAAHAKIPVPQMSKRKAAGKA